MPIRPRVSTNRDGIGGSTAPADASTSIHVATPIERRTARGLHNDRTLAVAEPRGARRTSPWRAAWRIAHNLAAASWHPPAPTRALKQSTLGVEAASVGQPVAPTRR